LAESTGEKKHEATPYRRQKAREQGQVARSQDLGSALILIGAVALLWTFGENVATALAHSMRAGLTQELYWAKGNDRATAAFIGGNLQRCLWALLPIMLGICAISLINNWFQVGFLFLPEKLSFDLQRINPMKGVKRLFELPNFARLGFGLLKIALITVVLVLGLWGRWDMISAAHALTASQVVSLAWDTTMDMCMRAGIVLLILAILDYGFQWWKLEQDLRMTDEEMREEMKMMNGDPQLIARRRSIQRQLAMSRMQNAVPGADVVITNPTELAIAIKFDVATMVAPIVVAKGAGHVAARIRKTALQAGIPVLERKPLAQALFKAVEIGQPIPVEQYAAVAEVLRYVYQLQGKKLPAL
jgi:flagellar biosynthesis protein FlhB